MHRSPLYPLGAHHVPQPDFFRLDEHMEQLAPAPPGPIDWSGGVDPGVSDFGNVTKGCCVVAAMDGALMFHAAKAGRGLLVATDEEATSDYVAITGLQGYPYDPRTGDNDTGCDPQVAWKYWRKTGILAGGFRRTIAAYGSVSKARQRDGLYYFGTLGLSLNLPDDWEEQLASGVWDYRGKDGDPSNGHEVVAVKWRPNGNLAVKTWKLWIDLTPNGQDAYLVGRDAFVDPAWFAVSGLAPSGFDLAGLAARLKTVA